MDKPSDRVNYAPGLLRYSYPPSGQMTANEFYPGGAPAATAWAHASRASSGRMATRSAACAEAALPRLVGELRRAGLHVRHPYKATRNVGKLLGDAAKCRAHAAVILGAEVAEGIAAVKDLASGEQAPVPIAELAATLRARRAAREAAR